MNDAHYQRKCANPPCAELSLLQRTRDDARMALVEAIDSHLRVVALLKREVKK